MFKALNNIEYISADLNSPRALVKVNMESIEYPNEYFNVVLSSHVLEHVNDDIKALKELYRIQNKNGWSIHIVPIDYNLINTFEDPQINTPKKRKIYYGHFDHKRMYGRDYKERLENTGFKVTVFLPNQYLSSDEIVMYGINPEEEIYYLEKN